MALSFTAIDIETAAAKWDTICSISLVRVRDGIVTDHYYTLVNPECKFKPLNIAIHGIKPEMVEDSPTFARIAPAIFDFIGDDVLVSHNMAFDGGVLQKTCARYNFEDFRPISTICTCVCAKKHLPGSINHKLPTICGHYNIELDHHHDADEDATACAQILIAIADELHAASLDALCLMLDINRGLIAPGYTNTCRAGSNADKPCNRFVFYSDPHTLLDDLRMVNADHADRFDMDMQSDGKTVSVKFCGQVIFYIAHTGTPYIKMPGGLIQDPECIHHCCSYTKAGDLRLPLNNSFNYTRFVREFIPICDSIFKSQCAEPFGCCNSFILCSDARRCQHENDPDYLGCQYRVNLEAGRIFYGVNKNN